MKRALKNRTLPFCIFALAIGLVAPLPRAHADMDPADRINAEKFLTSGAWKITFQKGWSIIRVFEKDGSFWTPDRPDETGRWTITNNRVVQTYTRGDKRPEELIFPLDAPTVKGTTRNSEPISATHENTAPAATPAKELTEQQKTAITDLLTSGRWETTDTNWDQPHFYHFSKNSTFYAEKRPSQQGHWILDGGIITLTFLDGHNDFVLLPLDPKSTGYADAMGAPGKSILLTPAPLNISATATSIITLTDATPTDILLSGQWKLTTKTRNDTRVFMKDGTFKTLNNPDAKGQWMINKDFVIMLLPAGGKDVIYMPLNPKGSTGLAENGDPLTATLESPAAEGGSPAPAATATPPPQDKTAATDLLVSGPWIFSTPADPSASRTRSFATDGTFTTAGHEDEFGWWKIVNNVTILTFADGHKESLKLPLDPKGTSGLDKNGAPVSAVMQAR